MYVCMYVCRYVCMYVCMYVGMYVCIMYACKVLVLTAELACFWSAVCAPLQAFHAFVSYWFSKSAESPGVGGLVAFTCR